MKKMYISGALVLALAAMLPLQSCIGNFNLTNNLMTWNKNVSNKFVNELIFFGFWVLPVYEVTALADLLVLNSIEFWSGKNPVERNTSTTVVKGSDGVEYLVESDSTGYTITSQADNSVVRLQHEECDDSWNVEADGQSVKIMSFIDADHVRMLDAAGGYTTVDVSAAGVMVYRASLQGALMAAAN